MILLCFCVAVAQVWYSNATVWDLLVAQENQEHLRKLLAENKLSYSVAIPDLQRAIGEENPALSDEEIELTGRKGKNHTLNALNNSKLKVFFFQN